MRSPAQHHVVDGENPRGDRRNLGHHCEGASPFAIFERRDQPPPHSNLSFDRHSAGYPVQKRSLTRTVGTDQANPFTVLDHEVDGLENAVSTEREPHSRQLDGAHVDLRFRRRTSRKNGAPTKAVTTPIGSSAGATTVRAATSAPTRKAPPIMQDSGRTRR